jgi:hypothetical protein
MKDENYPDYDENHTMVHHYVSNYLVRVRLSLEYREKDKAKKCGLELIKKLEGLSQGGYVKECINYSNETIWDSNNYINNFQKKYDALHEKIKNKLEENLIK